MAKNLIKLKLKFFNGSSSYEYVGYDVKFTHSIPFFSVYSFIRPFSLKAKYSYRWEPWEYLQTLIASIFAINSSACLFV